MLAAKNAIPLIFFGAIAGGFCIVFIYHVWSKRLLLHRPRVVDEETGSIAELDRDDRSDRTLQKPKKKTPKMWDVRIPKLGHAASRELDDEDEDDIDEKDAGKWDTIKPMSVAYIKNTQHNHTDSGSSSSPPEAHWSVIPGPPVDPTTPTTPPFRNFAMQQLESGAKRTAYDKNKIEAVQVSVLISMPTKPGAAKTKAPVVAPLELGVAKITLDDDKKWRRRTGTGPLIHGVAI